MPKLRFPGFEEEWEECQFINLFSTLPNNTLSRAELSETGEIKNIHYGDVLIKFGDTLDIKNDTIPYVKNKVTIQKNEMYLTDGDIVVADTAEDETVGKATELFNAQGIKVVAGLHTIPCRPQKHFASKYLGYYMNSIHYHKQLITLMQGIKVLSISKSNIAKTIVRYPSINEQEKISSFISLLDEHITKQRELVESLKSYKRGVLSDIFSGKIRFKDKDGNSFKEWKKCAIGSIFSERCERANGNEDLLAVTINSGVIKRNEIELKDNSSEDKGNYKCVRVNDIAYNTMRMWQGASGVSSYDGIVSPSYTVIYAIDGHNTDVRFWGYYFKTNWLICEFQRYSQGLTSDTWNLKYSQLADIEVKMPCVDEQIRIANFLDKLEETILEYEQYLDKSSVQRNKLLRTMFI